MDQYISSNRDTVIDFTQDVSVQKKFFASVFTYMTLGLAISGIVAYLLGTVYPVQWFSFMFSETGIKPLGYVIMFAPLVFTFAMGAFLERASTPTLMLIFGLFAIVMGMSISTIFIIYTLTSIAYVFAATAITFSAFAILGYTTKTDLTRLGTICGIGFGVLIIVSLLNFFLFESEKLSFIMSGVGVLLVIGLIAFKMQELKNIAAGTEYGTTEFGKRALIGAFMLYISFINLFMMLLRLFGRRD